MTDADIKEQLMFNENNILNVDQHSNFDSNHEIETNDELTNWPYDYRLIIHDTISANHYAVQWATNPVDLKIILPSIHVELQLENLLVGYYNPDNLKNNY